MPKFYVVWRGRTPGIYTSWDACKEQVHEYPQARYKSYLTRAEAVEAYGHDIVIGVSAGKPIKVNSAETNIKLSGGIVGKPKREIGVIESMRISLARFQEKIAEDLPRQLRRRKKRRSA